MIFCNGLSHEDLRRLGPVAFVATDVDDVVDDPRIPRQVRRVVHPVEVETGVDRRAALDPVVVVGGVDVAEVGIREHDISFAFQGDIARAVRVCQAGHEVRLRDAGGIAVGEAVDRRAPRGGQLKASGRPAAVGVVD